MHIRCSGRNAIPGIEVIPHAATDHVSECQVLSLRIEHPVGAPGIDIPDTAPHFEVGHNPPVTGNKITPDAEVEGHVPRFRPSRNRSVGSAECKIRTPP